MGKQKLFWRINEGIRAPEVRVIGADGKQIGILPLKKALEESKKLSLDLVEIAPAAKPPVTKIVNFGKFRYQEEKKARQEAKKIKGGDVKEIRLSPFIAQGDYQTRVKRIREFLEEKNKVRVVVVFTGRQMGSKPQGYSLLQRVFAEFGDSIAIDMKPKFLGKHLITVVSPVFKSRSNAKSKNQEINNQ